MNSFSRYSTTPLSSWKALMRTSGLMGGLDPKTAFAIVITPGFWLLRPEKATTLVFPMLNWKWMSPIGNTKTSPLSKTLVKSLFGLDVTNPTKRVPSITTKSSVPRGWMWGGFRPYASKSRRAKDMPRVLRPANISTFTRVTFYPTLFALFAVSAGLLSPEKKKSFATTIVGSLQNFPFTNTTQRKKSLLSSQIRQFL